MSEIRTPVLTTQAPAPRPGIYSQAIIANGFVFCSGQTPVNPETGKLKSSDISENTHQCIANLAAVLEAAGSSINHVVKVNVFITDMANFDAMNKVYMTYWGDLKPSRTCVVVRELPRDSDVEIECTAVLKPVANL